MPIEVRRFGVGHRRPDGPPGTVGIEGQVIQGGTNGIIAELAFGRRARIIPHTNPNTTYFIVIEGGGWVGVGDERTRIAAGEAVLWPADEPHAAWTEHSEMRAFVVEFAGADDADVRGILEGRAAESTAGLGAPIGPASGGLVTARAPRPDPDAGEPA